jgi:hypothetical protein
MYAKTMVPDALPSCGLGSFGASGLGVNGWGRGGPMMEAPPCALLEHIRELSTGAAQLARALPLFDPLRARSAKEQELYSAPRVAYLPRAATSNVNAHANHPDQS